MSHPRFPFASLALLILGLSGCSSPPPAEDTSKTDYSNEKGEPRADLLPADSDFSLLWADEFDDFNEERWTTGSHTFRENAAQFSPEMVEVKDGMLQLGLKMAETTTVDDREYLGAEVRSLEAFTYGRFETRAKFASGSGVVSSFFTYYDHWGDPELEENWNELDIEVLGGHKNSVHFNIIHWSEAGFRTTHETPQGVTFDPTEDFHDYRIDWLPEVVHFYIDGELVHSQTAQIKEQLKLPSKLMMNVWAVNDTPGLNAWAGAFDESALPTSAQYDWVKVYTYEP